MSFALFQRPGTVVFLDDDPDYLEMLALVLPRHWHLKLFLRPHDCINYLQQEPPFWEADAWNQQQLVEHWREGKPLIPQLLGYWSKYTERYALTRVCVVDYSMPAMDGLQVLGELVDWPGSRVLLTGQADEQVAVNAFNRGLIDQFIAKQTPDISHRLIDAVENLMAAPNPRHSQIWRATLTPQQNALLRVPSIGRDLTDFVSKRWVEHVVIGDPFGVLGMDADGQVSWLQLEPVSGLEDLAVLAQAEGLGRRCRGHPQRAQAGGPGTAPGPGPWRPTRAEPGIHHRTRGEPAGRTVPGATRAVPRHRQQLRPLAGAPGTPQRAGLKPRASAFTISSRRGSAAAPGDRPVPGPGQWQHVMGGSLHMGQFGCVSAALSVRRTIARLRLVAGAQNTAPNTPRASSWSRSASVSNSVPASSAMICSLPWWIG
jgi:CheY-like chemotaxis protein